MLTIKNKISIIFLYLTLMLTANIAAANVITELDHKAFMEVSAESTVVDVRTPEEYAKGHVPGAINIPLATVGDSISMFGATDTPIVVYCRSGYRAGKALEVLSEAGYTNLHHLEGDIKGWEEAGLEMEVPEAP